MTSPSIVWFRDDLRLADNPALRAAIERGEAVIALYVLDEESPGIRALGGAARWWLHHSLASLDERLRERGGALVLRRGPAERIVRETVTEVGAGAVYWNRRYGGAERAIDSALKASLRAEGLEVTSFAGSLLHEPWTVTTGSGTHYSVFTPFWRACLALPAPRAPLPEPRTVEGPQRTPATEALEDWSLLPTAPDWADGLRETWEPGEPAARRVYAIFSTKTWGTTTAHAMNPLPVPRRGCHRTSAGVRSARSRSGTRRWVSTVREVSSPNWAGASSPGTRCTTPPISPRRTCDRSSTPSLAAAGPHPPRCLAAR